MTINKITFNSTSIAISSIAKNDPKIKEMYLMLEELRISLFSQPMKTKMPISPTRLQKLWDRLAIG